MKMKMERGGRKINNKRIKEFAETHPIGEWPDVLTGKNGESIFQAAYLQRIFEDSLTSGLHKYDILDFKEIYKWPDLIQTNYKTNIKPVPMKIVGGGGTCFKTEQGMRLSEIQVMFGKKTESLYSYLGGKESSMALHLGNSAVLGGVEKDLISFDLYRYRENSKTLSRILSSKQKWDKFLIADGHPNIFESNELLDQIVIALLINAARSGRSKAHSILLALLYQKTSDFLKYHFKSLDNFEFKNLLDESIAFLSKVVRNDATLAARFVFPQNNRQSLAHFLLGSGRWVEKRVGFIPKLQEFLADTYVAKAVKDSEWGHKESLSEILESEMSGEKAASSLSKEFNQRSVESWTELQGSRSLVSDIRQEMNAWPKRDRRIFEMYLSDKKLEEIGKEHGLQKAAISKMISKRKDELLRKLS